MQGVDLTTRVGRKLIKTGGLELVRKKHKREQMSAFLFTDLFVLTYLHVGTKKRKKDHHKILLRNLIYTQLADDSGLNFKFL